jgi:penicillin G amidase
MSPMSEPNWPRIFLRLLGRRLARTRGRITVEGALGPISIHRDRWGIPNVEARSDHDAWFGLGFCHAQDRAFQLETLLRAGRGTLAEMAGPAALPIDRLSRRLGFARTATRQLARVAPDVRETLRAYVGGVNAGLAQARTPHELVLLRRVATRWQVTDVLAFAGLQSLALSANWDSELARWKVLTEDGPAALAVIDPVYPEWHPVTSPVGGLAGPPIGALAADLAALAGVVGGAGASNNWAIAGSRTASGRPILANDPHLASQLPAQWYLARLSTPEWSLAGASFVGGPAFPVGHNGFAAWGITAGLADSCDLFIEQPGPDGRSVRQGTELIPCEVRREEILVRGGSPVVEEVLITPRGPVISPVLEGVDRVFAMRAAWLDPLPIRGFLSAVRADSFEAFRRSFAEWPGPSLNIVYADAAGHVGWQLVGQVPRRTNGFGTLPHPGWEPNAGWAEEPVPLDEMPCALDPAEGYLATANNQPRTAGSEPFLGVDWIDGYRQSRIIEALSERDDWDAAACARLQVDVASVPWRELRSLVLDAPGVAGAGLALLRDWDGEVAADSSAASVYELLVSELAAQLAAAAAPKAWRWSLGAGFGPTLPRTLLLARSLSQLVHGLRTDASRVAPVLAQVTARLESGFGSDPAAWAWGRIRPLRLLHPFGHLRGAARIFNLGPVPLGGDANTLAQASVHPLDPLANPGAIPNTRAVIDLGDLGASRFVLAGGQSGNPLSPHYGDLFELWRRGEGVPIPGRPVATLRLDPKRAGG